MNLPHEQGGRNQNDGVPQTKQSLWHLMNDDEVNGNCGAEIEKYKKWDSARRFKALSAWGVVI